MISSFFLNPLRKLWNSFLTITLLEHEACIRDITELKWQLKVEREKLDRAQEKLSCTEGLNQRLLKDISFAEEQVPIVKEKIDLQKDLVNQISAKQAEVCCNMIYLYFQTNICTNN